jgi:transposase
VQVRPKYLRSDCKTISQADAPTRPLDRSYAGPGLLAHVLTGKYADHLPLYRQSEIYAREGVALSRSTLADWVGGSTKLLAPLIDALANYVKGAGKLHTDDTPVPVLQPGRGTTNTGRLWTYVRDDRASGGVGRTTQIGLTMLAGRLRPNSIRKSTLGMSRAKSGSTTKPLNRSICWRINW